MSIPDGKKFPEQAEFVEDCVRAVKTFGITAKGLADAMGKDEPTFSRWRRGLREMGKDERQELADIVAGLRSARAISAPVRQGGGSAGYGYEAGYQHSVRFSPDELRRFTAEQLHALFPQGVGGPIRPPAGLIAEPADDMRQGVGAGDAKRSG